LALVATPIDLASETVDVGPQLREAALPLFAFTPFPQLAAQAPNLHQHIRVTAQVFWPAAAARTPLGMVATLLELVPQTFNLRSKILDRLLQIIRIRLSAAVSRRRASRGVADRLSAGGVRPRATATSVCGSRR
jgi:hypothetical protein